MSHAFIQILVLAGVALFLILKLRDVLGTREGFEKPVVLDEKPKQTKTRFDVIDGGLDDDIYDYVDQDSDAASALAKMKSVEPDFQVGEFLSGARGAYEMILMAFEAGDLADIKPFLSPDILESFESVIEQRQESGLVVDAKFIGIHELKLVDAQFDSVTNEAEISIRVVCELTSVIKNNAQEVIEGNPNEIKKQKDTWTFARKMGENNPNWRLVATGD